MCDLQYGSIGIYKGMYSGAGVFGWAYNKDYAYTRA